MIIRKRNGLCVDFDKNKIVEAVTSALNSVGLYKDICKSAANIIADNVTNQLLKEQSEIDVETIQNMVEVALMEQIGRAHV